MYEKYHSTLFVPRIPTTMLFFGGTLMLAAERGIESTVVCFTDGQAATNRGDATSPEHLGEMRRAELLRPARFSTSPATSCSTSRTASLSLRIFRRPQRCW